MSFGGAVIGGIIGGIFGGGWGAAIGAFIGGALTGSPKPAQQSRETASLEPLKTLFRTFGKLAKSDGVVSREEADIISSFLHQTGLPSEVRKELIAAFNAGKTDQRSFGELLEITADSFPEQFYPQIMIAYCDIVLADGKIDERELAMLREAEKALKQYGFVDQWLKHVRERSRHDGNSPYSGSNTDDLTWAYQILGVSPQSSDDDVRKAWRNKAKEFHPDLLRGKGVEESVIRLAEEQMRRVNDAYEQIRKARGF